jgi:hypothetical protein
MTNFWAFVWAITSFTLACSAMGLANTALQKIKRLEERLDELSKSGTR